jgi:hypothetical protein
MFAQQANTSVTHWMQLVSAMSVSNATHVLWHDSDAFIFSRNFFEQMYRKCSEQKLTFLGIQQYWDHEAYEPLGFPNLLATWEMMVDATALRNRPAVDLAPQEKKIGGKSLMLDTSIWAQMCTEPERLDRIDLSGQFIHFGHVICECRNFERSKSRFEDTFFRLLLIRLLCDALNDHTSSVPTAEQLAQGLTQFDLRVVYSSQATRERYPSFRKKVQRILLSGLFSANQQACILRSLEPFDRSLGYPTNETSVDQRDIALSH